MSNSTQAAIVAEVPANIHAAGSELDGAELFAAYYRGLEHLPEVLLAGFGSSENDLARQGLQALLDNTTGPARDGLIKQLTWLVVMAAKGFAPTMDEMEPAAILAEFDSAIGRPVVVREQADADSADTAPAAAPAAPETDLQRMLDALLSVDGCRPEIRKLTANEADVDPLVEEVRWIRVDDGALASVILKSQSGLKYPCVTREECETSWHAISGALAVRELMTKVGAAITQEVDKDTLAKTVDFDYEAATSAVSDMLDRYADSIGFRMTLANWLLRTLSGQRADVELRAGTGVDLVTDHGRRHRPDGVFVDPSLAKIVAKRAEPGTFTPAEHFWSAVQGRFADITDSLEQQRVCIDWAHELVADLGSNYGADVDRLRVVLKTLTRDFEQAYQAAEAVWGAL